MKNITYEQFCEKLREFNTFNSDDLTSLYNEYGENRINRFFDIYSGDLKEEEFNIFAKKFSAYFDKINSNLDGNDNDLYVSEDTIRYMMVVAGKYPLLTPDEEKKCGIYLKKGFNELTIIDRELIDYKLYPDINIEDILLSVKYSNDYSSVIELLKGIKSLPYKLNDETILNDKMIYIKRYIKLFSDRCPNYVELVNYFPELDFSNKKIYEDKDLICQLDLLNKFITAKYNLYVRNLKLVISIAKKYGGKSLDFCDLIQEGNVGLVRAINRYDVDKGCKFSTYATWWIKQNITRSIATTDDAIRRPVHIVERYNKCFRFMERYSIANGCNPSEEEIATALGFTVEQVKEILSTFVSHASLDAPVNAEEDDSKLSDFIPDTENLPENIFISEDFKEVMKKAMQYSLTQREIDVICNRFGLDNSDGKTHTLEEVGQIFGVTRERARQIEAKALRKLYKKSSRNGLEDYRYE